MKQRIAVHGVMPSGGFGLKIRAVYLINEVLNVVTELDMPEEGELVITHANEMKDSAIVKTQAHHSLPVVHYLIGPSEADLSVVTFMNQTMASLPSQTKFLPLVSDQFMKNPGATCLYKPRKDGMVALRLDRYDDKDEIPAFKNTAVGDQHWVYSATQMRSILNIYTILDDGLIKVVFESVTADGDKKPYQNIIRVIESIEWHSQDWFSLERYSAMSKDDTIHFAAFCAQTLTRYTTSAVEFTLPSNDLIGLLRFAEIVDQAIAEAKKQTDYSEPYHVIQISPGSIYSCFTDLIISNISKYTVENEMSISMEDFLSRPGSSPAPDSVGGYLLSQIISNTHLAKYADLRELLSRVYTPGMPLPKPDKMTCIGRILGIDLDRLFGGLAALEDKLAIISQLENNLADEATFKKLKPAIFAFNVLALTKLIEPLLGKKIADDGKFYTLRHTELAVLLNANFCLLKDGRLSIDMKDNPGYLKYYAPGADNHEICEKEFVHLAKDLGLGFSFGNDFHDVMIFDAASSLMLRGFGVHINEVNLELQFDRAKSKVSVAPFSMFPAVSCDSKASVDQVTPRVVLG